MDEWSRPFVVVLKAADADAASLDVDEQQALQWGSSTGEHDGLFDPKDCGGLIDCCMA